ncbi:hypothetical protein KVP40.0289 [Vibrio phage KVP40]|uniref:Uncharacterized protein n=4 Tax=Schizotequatrovirus KVP40 TaxID=1914019 RepID=Q6WHL4_BPKVM|nr:hypothetical protein KVP40.0289 [Vibrio phage KVP40]AFN37520.1 hypothetical protein pp2_287 [Vibrio phage phi-pp2]QHJ74468.1 hypothetical protein VH12019_00141 [Vibrio phage VH1_2019]QIW91125.1 hypothetical protein COHAPHLL_00289 [Vibrio phage V09]UNA01803.1 hypothetical protein [Vibrio phage PC-Liy1]URQ03099.1 hypothetical protein PVA8_113 [Vibrio phage PVA8]WBM58835.1 hypothetical protein vBValMPVA8_113 [Vibrio phage vB_ValM_PVA8]WOL24821.1 hypothetical protein [Vibrio phage PG216]
MTFFQKLVAIFTNTPRPTEDILEDMNQKANELRARAQFDQEQIEANEAEERRAREEVERRAQELAARNAVHAQSKERAERVAKRVEEFTA